MKEVQLPVESWLKFLSTQVGRDKVYRFIQYFSRFLSYHFKKSANATDLAIRLNKLSVAVGLGRKLFRMGKPLDFLQTLLKTLNVSDEVIRWGTIMKCTGYGGWLLLDMIQWFQSVGVINLKGETMGYINRHAPRLWLFGILASLMVNLHKMQKNFMERQITMKLLVQGGPNASPFLLLDKEMRKVTKDTLQDLIDLVIPLSIIGWLDLSPGTVGLAGSITSLMGASSVYPTTTTDK